MAKKKKYDKNGLEILGQMTPEQYWKWRVTIEEKDHAETVHNLAGVKCLVMEHEITISKFKLIELRRVAEGCQTKVVTAEKEYANIKAEIEKEMGIDLKGCVIDPYSYDVKLLDNGGKTNGSN